ncbi:MAG TPA: alpha-galactosidase [Dermatophilaceae bacterium]|nr:alpha-galactosidase [Dermatophilaceae bacterium]
MAEVLHWRRAGVSVVLDCSGGRLPRVVYWGADLGELDDATVEALVVAAVPPIASGRPDVVVPLAVLPEQSSGWLGTPGLTGHRDGAHFSTLFRVRDSQTPGPTGLEIAAFDDTAQLRLDLTVELLEHGLLRTHARLTNTGADTFELGGILLTLPVPLDAAEILDFTGRHLRERSPQRRPFTAGTHLREQRGARSHDGTQLLCAGQPGFGFETGPVYGVHVAWSGNTTTLAERTSSGDALLGGGELLLAGEIRLAPGESYRTPELFGAFGEGLNQLSARFHDHLRSRPQHPASPRPVLINVWEAVYFNHDLDRLKDLADLAAEAGVERYVLDDGWFRARRDDTAGLGDWYVDADVWPHGLTPLVDHVKSLGMQFGLWFEPEMVNLDSDLARQHPDWVFAPAGRHPIPARNQQVLDLGNPDAWAYMLDRLDTVLSDNDIDYVKWDHNRDLVEAARSGTGQAGVHRQTVALYALLDELRRRHPLVEFESCAGGGGRPDLAIMSRAERVWASDTIDALERHQIQRYVGLLLPPEMIGSHIGSPHAHTTGRQHALSFRAGTAIFGHLGIEWDLTSATADDRAQLRDWVTAYKTHRDLLHHGRVVVADSANPAIWVHGVVAHDGGEALYAISAVTTSVWAPPGRARLPGLDPEARYAVSVPPPGDDIGQSGAGAFPLWWHMRPRLTGRVLGSSGIQVPNLHPEHLVLVHLQRVS